MLGRDEKVSPSKLNIAQYAIVAIFLVLSVGLWRLQISGNEKYSAIAEGNSIHEVDVLAPRGQIRLPFLTINLPVSARAPPVRIFPRMRLHPLPYSLRTQRPRPLHPLR